VQEAAFSAYILCLYLEFNLLSLHVWRKTLRGGMPAVLPTTIKSTAAERRRESRDTVPAFVVVYRVVTCAKLVRSVLDATDALTVLVS
jgi:hypothetical protein